MSDAVTKKNPARFALLLFGLPVLMLGLSFAAVPFYDWFCRVTGFSGTTQVSAENNSVATDVPMRVYFAANTAKDMPWEFKPKDSHVDIKIGETNLVFYEAYNPTDEVLTGSATFNVAPTELGGYFSKIDCFCFTEQTLQPKERVDMAVNFYVDPEILEDPDTKNLKELTLSYTFFLTEPSS